ncbi:cartilage acidic 1-like protein [Labeo rohita]|uniref:Cartilage acidic 1-like protein n=1 Tax=Labeo rohita TaxID=84645 RepID=A0A498NV60_LABRO|nr:cartilage acidic 1-like protein [Labeo rohita]
MRNRSCRHQMRRVQASLLTMLPTAETERILVHLFKSLRDLCQTRAYSNLAFAEKLLGRALSPEWYFSMESWKDVATSVEVFWPDGRSVARPLEPSDMNKVMEIYYPENEEEPTQVVEIECGPGFEVNENGRCTVSHRRHVHSDVFTIIS